jgi:hypothetical protein
MMEQVSFSSSDCFLMTETVYMLLSLIKHLQVECVLLVYHIFTSTIFNIKDLIKNKLFLRFTKSKAKK